MARYLLYDMKDNELLVCEGSVEDIAKFCDDTVSSIYCHISRKRKDKYILLKCRYEIVKDEENNND